MSMLSDAHTPNQNGVARGGVHFGEHSERGVINAGIYQ